MTSIEIHWVVDTMIFMILNYFSIPILLIITLLCNYKNKL